MILTRDNIIRYIKEKKAVIPTMIAEDFDTTTMIASAALSELAKDNLIKITYLKLSSSPYYYDPKQASILIELGEKHLKSYDKEIFQKIKEKQVINALSLSIQEALAIERIKDFAIPLEIEHQNKNLKFWVWYQRNIQETKKQILDVLNQSTPDGNKNKQTLEKTKKIPINKKEILTKTKDNFMGKNNNYFDNFEKKYSNNNNNNNNQININSQKIKENTPINEIEETLSQRKLNKFQPKETFEDKIEKFIENYFKENYLTVENKIKKETSINYNIRLVVNNIIIDFDCIYFKKKPKETDIIKFYSSSIKPKIIFIENSPKKLLKLSEESNSKSSF